MFIDRDESYFFSFNIRSGEMSRTDVKRFGPWIRSEAIVTDGCVCTSIMYKPAEMLAPKVRTKAERNVLEICDVASKYGVYISWDKKLARSLYVDTYEGEYVPQKYYEEVAFILARAMVLQGSI